jgi:hypothetical protein
MDNVMRLEGTSLGVIVEDGWRNLIGDDGKKAKHLDKAAQRNNTITTKILKSFIVL